MRNRIGHPLRGVSLRVYLRLERALPQDLRHGEPPSPKRERDDTLEVLGRPNPDPLLVRRLALARPKECPRQGSSQNSSHLSEDSMVAQAPCASEAVAVPHHGRKRSDVRARVASMKVRDVSRCASPGGVRRGTNGEHCLGCSQADPLQPRKVGRTTRPRPRLLRRKGLGKTYEPASPGRGSNVRPIKISSEKRMAM